MGSSRHRRPDHRLLQWEGSEWVWQLVSLASSHSCCRDYCRLLLKLTSCACVCGSCYSLRPPETVHQSGPESAVVSGELGAWAVGSEAVSHAGMPSIAMVQWAVHSLWLWRFLWQERCPHSWRSESSLSYISHTLGVQGAEGLGWLCSLRGLLSLF